MLKKRHKVMFSVLLCITMVLGFIPHIGIMPVHAAPTFAKGADVGWLSQLENMGIGWQNDDGVEQDVLQILKDHGMNSVRLRVFVNPPSDFKITENGDTYITGYTDKKGVVWMAERAKDLGMKVMINFHYSDEFADPGKQYIPSAWEGHSFEQLKANVYNHTYDVMSALANVGVYPEWVQVGNEINSGMMWPTGHCDNFRQLSELLNSGYDAVKAVSESTKVITHLANGTKNADFRWFFDNFITYNGGKTDIVGMSYYPYWDNMDYTQTIDALAYNLNDMVSRYGKEVMITEIGGRESDPTNTYYTIQSAIDKLRAVPNGKGIGVFYWEPEAHSSLTGYALGATTKVSNNVFRFTTALDAFRDNSGGSSGNSNFPDTSSYYRIVNRNSGKDLNVYLGSAENGAYIEQYIYGGWNSQKWKFTDDGGYYKIKNVQSGKMLDIEAHSIKDGAQNIQWEDNGGWNQMWQLVDAGSGYYNIKNRNSGKVLDIEARSTKDGALSIQWADNGGWNQMWRFEKVN